MGETIDFTRADIMMWQALPNLSVRAIAPAVAWYGEMLGFTNAWSDENGAVLSRDRITILLRRRKSGATADACYIYIRDANAFHAELKQKGLVIDEPPKDHPWGLRDFCLKDPDGNEITLGQPLW